MFVIIVITIMIAGSGKAIAQWEGGREGWIILFVLKEENVFPSWVWRKQTQQHYTYSPSRQSQT